MKKFLITSALFLSMTAAASAASICNVNTDHVNVRSGPSAIQFPVIDQVSNGHQVRVIGSTYNASGYRWVKIFYFGYLGRMTGWVDSDLVCE